MWSVLCLVIQSYRTLWDHMDCSLRGASVHRDSPGQKPGGGCHALLQGIFPTQGSNPGLLRCGQILYQLSYQGNTLNVVNTNLLSHSFCRSEVQEGSSESSCLGTQKTEVSLEYILLVLHSLLDTLEKIFFQPIWVCWLNSISCDFRNEVSISLWSIS